LSLEVFPFPSSYVQVMLYVLSVISHRRSCSSSDLSNITSVAVEPLLLAEHSPVTVAKLHLQLS
jgi:hypothetical protein